MRAPYPKDCDPPENPYPACFFPVLLLVVCLSAGTDGAEDHGDASDRLFWRGHRHRWRSDCRRRGRPATRQRKQRDRADNERWKILVHRGPRRPGAASGPLHWVQRILPLVSRRQRFNGQTRIYNSRARAPDPRHCTRRGDRGREDAGVLRASEDPPVGPLCGEKGDRSSKSRVHHRHAPEVSRNRHPAIGSRGKLDPNTRLSAHSLDRRSSGRQRRAGRADAPRRDRRGRSVWVIRGDSAPVPRQSRAQLRCRTCLDAHSLTGQPPLSSRPRAPLPPEPCCRQPVGIRRQC